MAKSSETAAPERVRIAAPAIFVATSGGVSKAIVQKADGSMDAIKAGDAGVLYASGLGPVDTAIADSAATPRTGSIRVVADVQVWVNGVAQSTFFAGLTPGQVGLYQVNFVGRVRIRRVRRRRQRDLVDCRTAPNPRTCRSAWSG